MTYAKAHDAEECSKSRTTVLETQSQAKGERSYQHKTDKACQLRLLMCHVQQLLLQANNIVQ
jgi:hypothetical protein